MLIIPGARAFSGDHKLLFAFPAVALLAVIGVVKLFHETAQYRSQFRRFPRERPDRAALVAGTMVLIVLSTTVVAGIGNGYYASNVLENDIEDDRASVTTAVEGIDGPVYGYNVIADLYVFSDVEPGTSYLGTIYSDDIAREKIADLERNDVRYVVVKDHQVFEGKVVAQGYWTDHKSTMTAYLNEHYEPVRRTEDYVVLKRTSQEEEA